MNSDMPLVSWLMPVYNAEKYIRRAMDSMLEQTYSNFEIVLIAEDCCTDNTIDICNGYAKDYNNIRVYINKGHKSVAGALNYGMNLCDGDYIARMDADDFSHPTRLEKQVSYMESDSDIGVLGCWCNVVANDSTYIAKHPTDKDIIRATLLFKPAFTHPTVMLNAKIFKENRWKYPDCVAEDYALWASLLSKTKMVNVPEVLLDYYEHENSLTHSKFLSTRNSSAKISKQALNSELAIDTDIYPDAYFGWRGRDAVPDDVRSFLVDGAKLLMDIQAANQKQRKFNDEALTIVLDEQWMQTKRDARMSTLDSNFDEIEYLDIDAEIAKWEAIICETPKIIVFGAGRHSEAFFLNIKQSDIFDVVAFCDSDINKWGAVFFEKAVIPPEQIVDMEYDYIFIASPIYEDEIRNILVNNLHIKREQIYILPPADEIEFSIRRHQYDKIYSHTKSESKAYLFCAPDYGNLGDHAIAEAILRFFHVRVKKEIVEVPFTKYYEVSEIVRHHVRPFDLILITGGGFLGSLWFGAELQVREVVKTYKNNPIIIMPQTLFWENSPQWNEELMETQKIYASHPDLSFCARDAKTHSLVRELYPSCNTLYVPDMVMSFDWSKWVNDGGLRQGALICLKNDKESVLSEIETAQMYVIGKNLCKLTFDGDTDLKRQVDVSERETLLRNKLSEFKSAELVITDRLHGLIFAAITGTPCVALNNYNHKLRETFAWVKHMPYVGFADNIDECEMIAKQVMSVGNRAFDYAPLETHFTNLEKAINNAYVRANL